MDPYFNEAERHIASAVVGRALGQITTCGAIFNVATSGLVKWLPKAAPDLIEEAQRERARIARTLADYDAALAACKPTSEIAA